MLTEMIVDVGEGTVKKMQVVVVERGFQTFEPFDRKSHIRIVKSYSLCGGIVTLMSVPLRVKQNGCEHQGRGAMEGESGRLSAFRPVHAPCP